MAVGSAQAEDVVAEFLSIPVDAASAATGGADVARPESGISPFANPAAAVTDQTSVSFTHVQWLVQQRVNAMQVRVPLDQGRGGLAFTGRFVDHGSIPRFDSQGAALRSLEPVDLSFGVAYGVRFDRFIFGVGGEYLQENLDITKGTGYTADAGMLVDLGPVRVGAAAHSLVGSMEYANGETYDLRQRLSFGVSYFAMQNRVEANVQYTDVAELGALQTLGIHWHAVPGTLVLRAGLEGATDPAYSDAFSPYRFGFQVSRGTLALDYAFVPHEELGQAHMVGLRWSGR